MEMANELHSEDQKYNIHVLAAFCSFHSYEHLPILQPKKRIIPKNLIMTVPHAVVIHSREVALGQKHLFKSIISTFLNTI